MHYGKVWVVRVVPPLVSFPLQCEIFCRFFPKHRQSIDTLYFFVRFEHILSHTGSPHRLAWPSKGRGDVKQKAKYKVLGPRKTNPPLENPIGGEPKSTREAQLELTKGIEDPPILQQQQESKCVCLVVVVGRRGFVFFFNK
jgi:hypothetical protein